MGYASGPPSSVPTPPAPRRPGIIPDIVVKSTIRFRVVLAGATALLILALVFAATLVSVRRVRQSVDRLSSLHRASEAIRSVSNALLNLEVSQRGFLLTGDSSYLVPFDSSLRLVERRMDTLQMSRPTFPDATLRFSALDSLVGVQLSQLHATLAAFSGEGTDAAIRQLRRNHATGAMDSIQGILSALDATGERQRGAIGIASGRAHRNLMLAEVLGGLFTAILLLTALRQILAELDAREVAESSLRVSERFLDSVIDLLPLMVFVKEADSLRFVRFNRTAEHLVGLSREAVLGRTDFDLFPKPLAEGFATMDRAVLASDAVRDIPEEVLVAPTGAVRTLHTRKVAIRDDAGNATFLVGVSEDITERKRAETQILRARETAEAANRAKSDFLAKMSHELRTPLNSIIGFSQLIDEESIGPLNDRQRRYVRNVLNSGHQLLDLINDILDLSKVEAGRMELSLTHSPLLPLLHDALAVVEPLALQRQLRLVLDAPADLPPLLVDVVRFRQIFNNLLGNAIKFTAPGGSVTLSAALAPSRVANDAHMVRITVLDTGVGIRPDDLERIFREFEQVDADPARSGMGTGLGLPLARRLAELHGGRVWAESEFGFGSSFHVELPVTTDVDAETTVTSTRAASSPGRASDLVLLVADESLAEQARATLGHERRLACLTHVADALERIPVLKPAIVVLDVALPAGGAVMAIRAISLDPRMAATPILLVARDGADIRALSLGQFDWLLKPVQRDALVATLQRVVASAGASYPSVLAIDSDGGELDVLHAIVEGAGFRARTATDATQGLALARELTPEAVVFELSSRGMPGFELVASLRSAAATRNTPLVMYSDREPDAAAGARIALELRDLLTRTGSPSLADELGRHRRTVARAGALKQ